MRALYLSCLLFLAASSNADDLTTAVPHRYFTHKGVKIAYRLFGIGQPLFLLNGGPGRSSETFTDLATHLASITNRQVILFDQRGTGRSELPVLNPTTVTLDLMVEDLEGLRKHLGFRSISIMGHSFGGMYAMAYTARYPKNVDSLILSCSGGIDLKWQDYVQHNMLSRLTADARKRYEYWTSNEQMQKDAVKASTEATKLLVPAYVYHQEFVPQLKDDLTNPKYSTFGLNPLVWESMKNYDLSNSFHSFASPTLILDGRQDILGEELQIKIQRAIPQAQLKFIDECSHYPWLDAPEIYFSYIKEFLK